MSALRIMAILLALYVVVAAIVYFRQRSLLYFPTHEIRPMTTLAPWSEGGRTIGYCREAPNPLTIWLMMHGNGGQAADRDYVLPRMSVQDSLYVLEYPGYGSRAGNPSLRTFNEAAFSAYRLLRERHPRAAICALGESLGSGPACALARATVPPDKIVLVVPFDDLASVAAQHFPFLPVRLLLRDSWDNVKSLAGFAGPVEIFAARDDAIIPVEHARRLAGKVPGAQFTEIAGGHNDWAQSDQVKIRH
jgi:fermentation-respiration switch protein FrsA (DUF1100 family)